VNARHNLPPWLTARASLLWIAGGAVVGLVVLVTGLVVLPLVGTNPAALAPTAVLTVIPYPSETPTPTVTLTPEPTEEATPTSTPPASAGSFTVGQWVQIEGTEGDGLRLRDTAGLAGTVLLVALESEVFEVREGPQQADGYTWWFLVNPYDSSKRGWGVDNYLRPADSS
jgi:hypothetical protein